MDENGYEWYKLLCASATSMNDLEYSTGIMQDSISNNSGRQCKEYKDKRERKKR